MSTNAKVGDYDDDDEWSIIDHTHTNVTQLPLSLSSPQLQKDTTQAVSSQATKSPVNIADVKTPSANTINKSDIDMSDAKIIKNDDSANKNDNVNQNNVQPAKTKMMDSMISSLSKLSIDR